MTGKSVDYLAFVGDPVFSIVFSKTTNDGKGTQDYDVAYASDYSFSVNTDVEIYTDDAPWFGDGTWRWTAYRSDVELASAWWNISPLTGSMDTGDAASPYDMMAATSSTGPGWAVSYGFYDAGSSWDGDLTNHDQSYVYVTPAVDTVLADITSMSGALKTALLSSFVLAGAHDAGTYDMTKMTAVCDNANLLEAFKQMIVTYSAEGYLSAALAGLAGLMMSLDSSDSLKMVQDFAVTQKDDVSTLLDLGVRYFDFRPGYCAPSIRNGDDNIYHQHTCIPGVLYSDFMTDVFTWLTTHPNEIVVVSLNFQGFADVTNMAPAVDALDTLTSAAQTAGCKGQALINTGGLADLATPYDTLITENRRVIFLNQIAPAPASGRDTNSTAKYDSYSDIYKTLDPSVIVAQLEKMTVAGQAGSDYTVMQLQATAQGVKSAAADTVTDDSWSGSPLMATKATCDAQTYPWLRANLRKNLGSEQLIVLLNNFADNALAFHTRLIMTS